MPDPISMDDFLKGAPAPSAPSTPAGLSADDFLKGTAAPSLPDTSRRGGSAVYANPDNPDQVPFSPLQASQYDRLIKDPKTDATRMQGWFKAQGLPVPSANHVQPVIDFVRKHPTAVSPTYYTVSHDPTYGTPSEDASYQPAEERTFGQQFTDSMNQTHSSSGEGVIGALKRVGLSQQDDEVIRDYGSEHGWSGQQIDDAIHASKAQRKINMEGDRAQWAQADDNDARLHPDGAIGRFASSQLGGLVGDANPSYLVAPEVKPLTAAIQRLAPTLGHVVAPLAEQIAERFAAPAGRAAGMGAVQGGTDIGTQAADIGSGARDHYDPLQTVEHAAVGAAMQGGLEGVLHGVPAVKRWFDDFGNHDTPEPTLPKTPEALTQLDQDIQLIQERGLTPSHFRTPEEITAAAAKIRMANPEPSAPLDTATYYHGSPTAGLTELRPNSETGVGDAASSGNAAVYFHPDRAQAATYSKGFHQGPGASGAEGAVYEANLNYKKPFFVDDDSGSSFVTPERAAELKADGYDAIVNRANGEVAMLDSGAIKLKSGPSVTERQAAGTLGEKAKGYGTSDLRNPPAPEATPTAEPEVGSIISRMTDALNTAGKASEEQTLARKEDMKARVQAIHQAQWGVNGEGGYHAALAALKGERPAADFEGIRPKFDQREIDVIFTHISKDPAFSWGDKLAAHSGMTKLLEGKVPAPKELTTLGQIFPNDFIKAAMKNRSKLATWMDHANNAINLPRALVSTADLSIPLRQGVFMVGRPEFYSSFVDMIKQAGSENYYKAAQADIKARPSYPLMEEAGLAINDLSHDAMNRPEQFRSNWAEKIPIFKHVVKFSERAAVGFSNKLRADVFDSMMSQYDKAGVDIASNAQGLKNIGSYINAATGRGKVPFDKVGRLASDVFFSPQLLSSRVTLLNPLTYILEKDPILRDNKLRDLAMFGTIGASVLSLAGLAGAKVGTDPLSSNWGKMEVGHTHIDIFGGFQQVLHLAAVLAMNERTSPTGATTKFGEGYKPETRLSTIGRFLRSKESPVASIVHDHLDNSTYIGPKPQLVSELIDHFVPFSGQDLVAGYQQDGAEGVAANIPSIFGVGTQAYGGKPAATGVSAPSGISAEDFLKGNHPPVSQEDFLKGKPTTTANATAESILRSVGLEPTDTGIRSHATQEELYRDYNGVAAPGTSPHEKGNAIDIRPSKTVRPEDVVATLEGNGYTGVRIITRKHGSGPHWHVQWEGYQS